MFAKLLPESSWQENEITLEPKTGFQKLVIFDLDETLVH
jgi:hypothetical protein